MEYIILRYITKFINTCMQIYLHAELELDLVHQTTLLKFYSKLSSHCTVSMDNSFLILIFTEFALLKIYSIGPVSKDNSLLIVIFIDPARLKIYRKLPTHWAISMDNSFLIVNPPYTVKNLWHTVLSLGRFLWITVS